MANLDDFFGKAAVAKNKKRKNDSSASSSLITKKTKTNLSSSASSSYFKKKPDPEVVSLDSGDDEPPVTKRKSTPKKSSTIIDLDDDEDAGFQLDETPKSSPKKTARAPPKSFSLTPTKKTKTTPKKAVTPKSKVKAKPAPTPTTSTTSGPSAQEILKTIPDADPSYLETKPGDEKLNFHQLMARKSQAPTQTNDKVVPIGRPNCLNGLTIVFTGNLPSLDRAECETLATQYGAKVTKSISGKTSLVVIGNEAGPKKKEAIKQKKIKCIDEDGFVQLIGSMPADGGSGEEAQKTLAKKQEEERKAIEKAVQEEEEAENERQLKLEKQKLKSSQLSSSGKHVYHVEKPSDKPDSEKLWTVRYAPTNVNQICGNKGNVENITKWLENWFPNARTGFKGSGINAFRSILISGPPGTGKTTAAHLIAKKLGYDIIEKNASDVRSKKLLISELKTCLDNTSVVGYFNDSEEKNARKFVIIMDEVDGMSSGDHGGVGQLSQFCKITETPLILICNDKSLPKMRTFDRTCFDMTWRRPTGKEMKSRLMTIAHREGLKLDPNVVDQLVAVTHNDIRQIINIMSTVSRTQKSLDFDNAKSIQDSWQKEVVLKPFDVLPRLLSSASYGSNGRYNLNDKIGLYFNDMDLTPLMMHENYRLSNPAALNSVPASKLNLTRLELLDKAADSISESDLVNNAIRSGEQQWSLLPFHAITSCILPGSYVCGQISGRINFASWLGQNSKKNKYNRLLQELQYHSSTKTMTNNQELRLSYIPFLTHILSDPLIEKQSDGIAEVLKMLDEYYFTREDWDTIMEFGVGSKGRMDQVLKGIKTATKTAFTRKYNSYTHPTIIYKTGDSVTSLGKSKRAKPDLDDVVDDDMEDKNDDDDDQDKDDLKKDKLIKAVKRKAVKPTAKKKTTKSKR